MANSNSLDKKIVIVGPPNVGKTSLRLAFFDGTDPTRLIDQSIAPTRRVETKAYGWLGINIACFDIPGQSLLHEGWLGAEGDRIFTNTDAVIFMTETAPSAPDISVDTFRSIAPSLVKLCSNADIHILIHKSDTVDQTRRADLFSMATTWLKTEARKFSQLKEPKFYLTSLLDGSAFEAMRHILNTYTRKGQAFQRICDDLIKDSQIIPASARAVLLIFEAENGCIVAQRAQGFPETNPTSPVLAMVLKMYVTATQEANKEIRQRRLDGQVSTYEDYHLLVAPVSEKAIFAALVPKTVQLGMLHILKEEARKRINALFRVFDTTPS